VIENNENNENKIEKKEGETRCSMIRKWFLSRIIWDMGALSRNKGARLERDAASWLEDVTGIKFRRALDQYQASSGKDLIGDSPLVVQVKGGKMPPIWKAYAEAEGESNPGEVPIAIIKRDRYPWMIVLNREDFAPMLAAWLREREREDERTSEESAETLSDLRQQLRAAEAAGDDERVNIALRSIRDSLSA
jgi:hypothetical protein